MLPLEARGKAQQGRRSEVKLNLKPQTAQVMAATAVRLAPRLTLPPGRYQLRVAAKETGGLTGSVFYDLTVPDFTKQKFDMSGVVLTAATRPGHADRRARSDPQADAARPADDAARVLPDRRPGALRRGLRQAADRRAAHRRRDDAPGERDRQGGHAHRGRAQEQRVPAWQGRRRFFGYSAQVPLADVPPGRYMLQVEAKARIKDAPAVRREMLITIVQPPPDLVRPAAKPGASRTWCRTWRRRPLRPTPSPCWGCRRGRRRPWRGAGRG